MEYGYGIVLEKNISKNAQSFTSSLVVLAGPNGVQLV